MGYSYTKTVYTNTAGDVFRSKANILASNQPQYWMVGETCMYGTNGLKWSGEPHALLRHTNIVGGVTTDKCCLIWDSERGEWLLLPEHHPIAQTAIAETVTGVRGIRDVKPGSTVTYNGKRVHYYGKKDIFIIPSSVDDQNDVEKKHVYSPVHDEDKLHLTKTMKITAVHEEGGELLPDGEYRNNRWQRIIVADEIKRVWWTVGNTNNWSRFSTYQGDLYFSPIHTEVEKRRCRDLKITGDPVFSVSLTDGFSLGEGKRSCPVDQYVDLLLCVETNTGTITRPVTIY